jgi:hypothetical protein
LPTSASEAAGAADDATEQLKELMRERVWLDAQLSDQITANNDLETDIQVLRRQIEVMESVPVSPRHRTVSSKKAGSPRVVKTPARQSPKRYVVPDSDSEHSDDSKFPAQQPAMNPRSIDGRLLKTAFDVLLDIVMKEVFDAVTVNDLETMSKRRFRRFVTDLKLIPAQSPSDAMSNSTDSALSRELTMDDVNRVLETVVNDEGRLDFAAFCKALVKIGSFKHKLVIQAARSQRDRNATETALAVLGSRWALCKYQLVPYLDTVGVDVAGVSVSEHAVVLPCD